MGCEWGDSCGQIELRRAAPSPVRRTEVAARCPRAMQEDERQEILRRRARAAEMVLRETQLWQARVPPRPSALR